MSVQMQIPRQRAVGGEDLAMAAMLALFGLFAHHRLGQSSNRGLSINHLRQQP